ncbi:MAG TPA: hypothetical protein VJK51_01435 [Candidatus Nanoarchaeia archaeon]|nr:hypothetical protein [Candidatus Nanoarchaeia archaeon]
MQSAGIDLNLDIDHNKEEFQSKEKIFKLDDANKRFNDQIKIIKRNLQAFGMTRSEYYLSRILSNNQ